MAKQLLARKSKCSWKELSCAATHVHLNSAVREMLVIIYGKMFNRIFYPNNDNLFHPKIHVLYVVLVCKVGILTVGIRSNYTCQE